MACNQQKAELFLIYTRHKKEQLFIYHTNVGFTGVSFKSLLGGNLEIISTACLYLHTYCIINILIKKHLYK